MNLLFFIILLIAVTLAILYYNLLKEHKRLKKFASVFTMRDWHKKRGTEDEYFIWIRTPACRFPWDRYIVSFKPDQNWTSIEIPFNDFKKSNFYIRNKMNTGNIETLAIAAYGKDFSAQVDIAHLEFY